MAILWKFEFNVSTTYVIEVGNQFFRFLNNNAYILDGSDPYAIASPFLEADLPELQYRQINDVIFITHPEYPPQKLSRIAADEWTLEEIAFDVPPTLDENVDDSFTITPSGTTGSISLTASDDLFDAAHVGGYFRIGYIREADTEEIAITANGTSSSLSILGPWTVRSYGNWTADIVIQRSRDGGSNWETVHRLKGSNDRNVDVSGTEDDDNLLRLKIENWSATLDDMGSPITNGRAILESSEAELFGTVQITAVSSATAATGTVTSDLYATSATAIWAEGAWSEYRGYPRAVEFHEGRIWYGGTLHEPLKIWGSVVDDFENFDNSSTADDMAVSFQMASSQTNAIQWMVSMKDLVIGLAGGEWRVRGDRNGQSITPSRVDAKPQSSYGSEYQQPLVVGSRIVFLERRSRSLREMVFSYEIEAWDSATDLNLLAEHVLQAGVKQMAFQRVPVPTIWCVLNDGTCAAMTYDRNQNVQGWHRHQTTGADGLFKSVVSTYGDPDTEDEVYFIVERTIGSTTVEYIERLDSNRWTEKQDAFFVDSGLTYDGTPVTSVSGLDHLIGENVDALVDGRVYLDLVVDSGGSVSLPSGEDAGSVWQVGLRYRSVLSPFRFDADSALGVHSGSFKRIDSVVLRLYKSLGMDIEIEGTDVALKTPEAHPNGDTDNPDLLGNDRPQDLEVDWTAGSTYDPTIVISQENPLPMSVMSIAVGYTVASG